jgi:hypothetical protein
MNSVDNLKSTQFRELFKIFNSIPMQSLNIFRIDESFFLNLQVWVEFGNLKEYFYWARPTCRRPVFVLTAQDGHPVPHTTLFLVAMLTTQRAARRRWPLVVAAPRRQAPLSLCPDFTIGGHRPFRSPSHHLTAAPHCSTLHWLQLRPASLATDELPPGCPIGRKEAPRHRTPPAPRTYPWLWLANPSNESSPAVIFLYEHPAVGSPLWLFPDPIDPTASSSRLDQSFGPLPARPPCWNTCRCRNDSSDEHPLLGLHF